MQSRKENKSRGSRGKRTLSPGDASEIFVYAISAHRTRASQNSVNVSLRMFSCPSVASSS